MNPATALAGVLVDELARSGVADVVLAPGSRNAPLALALHEADSARRLRLHVRVDERTAGFLALGLARSAGIAAVVTTSGTAVANLHPAVLEAHHAGIPLVVVSADRPDELRGVGANQTVDQAGIFGRTVRLFRDVAAPGERLGQVGYWRSTVARACLAAQGVTGGDPGPVHLNVAFREPLVPDDGTGWVEPLDGRPEGRAWTSFTARDVGGPVRTLVVVGDVPTTGIASSAASMAARRGWPVVAEPQARAGGVASVECAPLVVGADDWLARHAPDRVLVVGRPTLSRPVLRLLTGELAPVEVVTGTAEWPDPGHAVHAVYPYTAMEQDVGDPGDPAFLTAWRKAGEWARVAVDAVLAETADVTAVHVAKAVVDALPPEALLYLGSSSAVRDVDLVGGRLPAWVLANRGVAGIDGTVSSALGAALGRPGVPSYALLGDVTALHDANGLVLGPTEPRPDLCLVVVNDNGGGIFGLLEQGAPEHGSAFERVFGTPHNVDLTALCASAGVPHERTDLDGLPRALIPRPGLRVVEVTADRTVHRNLHARLRAAVSAALR